MFQGTLESNLTEGAGVVRAYNTLGYAAAAIGNHEFDFGPAGPDETPRTPGEGPRGALKARAAEARFPFLAANTVEGATGQPASWPNVKPSTTVMVRGVRIGLIGVTTIDTAAQTIAATLPGLTFTPLAPAITREAMSLRSRGATVVIVLAHAGGRCTRLDDPEDLGSCDQMAEIVNVARQLPGGLVDMISAGHTHQAMAQDVAGIAGADAAIGNGGSLRADVPAGPLTYGAVYEVYPFDNRLVTFTATGDQLTRIVAYNLQRRALPAELLPIAGLRVDATCEGGMLRVALTRSSGMPIRPEDRLTVTTSDFIAGGGDGILAPAGPLQFKGVEGAPLLREAVVAWLRQRGGRLDESQFLAPGNRRWSYPAPRPVTCQ